MEAQKSSPPPRKTEAARLQSKSLTINLGARMLGLCSSGCSRYCTQQRTKGVDILSMRMSASLTLLLPLCELLRFLWVPNTGANTSTDDTCFATSLSHNF